MISLFDPPPVATEGATGGVKEDGGTIPRPDPYPPPSAATAATGGGPRIIDQHAEAVATKPPLKQDGIERMLVTTSGDVSAALHEIVLSMNSPHSHRKEKLAGAANMLRLAASRIDWIIRS